MGFGKRLSEIRGETKQEELAKSLGVSKNTFARYEREETYPDYPIIRNICEKFGINTDWLVFGTGPMRRQDILAESQQAFASKGSIHLECSDPERYYMVPLLESRVTAGPEGEIIYGDVEDYLPFRRWWVERIAGAGEQNLKQLLLIRVRGDSMSPTINQGEVALVDTRESERLHVQDGRIYLIVQPDGSTSIKRLVFAEKDGKPKLICLSDNTTVYRPFYIDIERSRSLKEYVLGRVRWAGKEFE